MKFRKRILPEQRKQRGKDDLCYTDRQMRKVKRRVQNGDYYHGRIG